MIITEKEKSKVVLSSLLERHYPELELELWDISQRYGNCFSHERLLGKRFYANTNG